MIDKVIDIIWIHIIYYIIAVNSYMTKDEVLKIKNNYYISFYCKDNICVEANYSYSQYTIDIPDVNGNVTSYIVKTCRYDEAISGKCKNKKCYNQCSPFDKSCVPDCKYYTCTNNSDCLSNKCVNNTCVFNENNPIVHCDSIYSNIFYESSYMHCGKPVDDVCNTNDECSSNVCNNGGCTMQLDGPSDNRIGGVKGLQIICILLCICIISCLIYRCYTKKKKEKKINNYNNLF